MGLRIETFRPARDRRLRRDLERVQRYVVDHLADELDLAAGAHVAGLGKSAFCTRFRRSVGVGFPEWVTRVRVARAVALLEAGELSVSSVSKRVGFRSLRTFQRSFKRIAGMTAADCKRRTPS